MGEHEQARAGPRAPGSWFALAALGTIGIAHLAIINLVLAPKLVPESVSSFASATAPASNSIAQTSAPSTGSLRRDFPRPTPSPKPPTATTSESHAATVAEPAATATSTTSPAPDPVVAPLKPPPQPSPVAPKLPEQLYTHLRVSFPTRSWEPSESDRTVIGQAAAQWKRSPTLTVYVVGHTDARGSFANNLVLSRHRAERVAEELHRKGVPMKHIRIKAEGERIPLDPSDSPRAWATNRRVEILLR